MERTMDLRRILAEGHLPLQQRTPLPSSFKDSSNSRSGGQNNVVYETLDINCFGLLNWVPGE